MENIDNLMKIGKREFDNGNKNEAYSYFKRVVEQDCDNWEANYMKGLCLLWLANLKNGNESFTIAINTIKNSIKLLEKSETNSKQRNIIAKNIDEYAYAYQEACIENFNNIVYRSKGNIDILFKQLDEIIRLEKFAISLYIEKMPTSYKNTINNYKKRIVFCLSEKSKVFEITGDIVYLTDTEREKSLNEYNKYVKEIKNIEKNYNPTIFDEKNYQANSKKKDIIISIISVVGILILIGLAIWLFTYNIFIFGAVVFFIIMIISDLTTHKIRKNLSNFGK